MLNTITNRDISRNLKLGIILFLCLGLHLSSIHIHTDSTTLKAGVVFGSMTYFKKGNINQGFEQEVLQALANTMDKKLEIVEFDSKQHLLKAVASRRVDIGAAEICNCDNSSIVRPLIQYSKPIMDIESIIIRHRDSIFGGINQMVDRNIPLLISRHSIQYNIVDAIQEQYPALNIEITDDYNYQIMQKVQQKGAIAALISEPHFLQKRSFFPHLRKLAVEIEGVNSPLKLTFALPNKTHFAFIDELNQSIDSLDSSGKLMNIIMSNIHPLQPFDFTSALTFKRKIDNLLPTYESLFKEVAKEYLMDWLLLASVAYQESHWNPKARSFTNVRGLMMLTQVTAEQLGVEDLLDPEQSLRGGAEYLTKIYHRLQKDIIDPDRLRMALAAYNIGYGHLQDARRLAEKLEKDPNSWGDLREVLPLLSEKKYYKWLRYGSARGYEAVSYVDNIGFYQSILKWYLWQETLNQKLEMQQQNQAALDLQTIDKRLAKINLY